MLNLLTQPLKLSVELGGLFRDITQDIWSTCQLSPIIASFYLYEWDKEMAGKSVHYKRYMDDIIVLSPSRWKLRQAIKTVNQDVDKLKLKQHLDKIYIGRIKNGFDFWGYQFGREKLTVSKRRLENQIRRLTPLYEPNKNYSCVFGIPTILAIKKASS